MTNDTSIGRRKLLGAGVLGASGMMLPGLQAMAAPTKAGQGFVWGVAAASAQTESRRGRGRSNWDVFADTPGKIEDGSTNVRLTEFDTRYTQDFDLLKAAGVPAFRVSLAWPRIQPDGPGTPSKAGLDHYDRMFDAMLARGIEPWVTLFHWDVPVWAGDFRSRDIAPRMAEYADIVVNRFGDRVNRWIMLNEPNTVALLGYGFGTHAPGVQDQAAMMAAIHHQNLALGLMTRAARSRARPGSLIGTTHNVAPIRSPTQDPADVAAAAQIDTLWNWAFLDPLFGKGYPAPIATQVGSLVRDGDLATIAAKQDFLGVNHYSSIYVQTDPAVPGGLKQAPWPDTLVKTALFPVEPAGLTEVLLNVRNRYGDIPLYITETGFALDRETDWSSQVNDPRRTEYIDRYLAAAAQARAQGVDLRGLFYWSATDNWEWASGFTKRFGLIAVDMATQRRSPKRSLAQFGGQIRRHFPNAIRAAPARKPPR